MVIKLVHFALDEVLSGTVVRGEVLNLDVKSVVVGLDAIEPFELLCSEFHCKPENLMLRRGND